jgi:heme a synthase
MTNLDPINAPKLRNWQLRVLRANLVVQTGIVITGALVRVTSSGLGCPTWPECVAGSITPTSAQTQAWHKYVEFGNRLLTFVLVVVAVAAIFAIRQHNQDRLALGHQKRKTLTLLSLGTFLGIFAQAILGGITVLTGLNPFSVASHFLLSIGLITVAQNLLTRATELQDRPIANRVHVLVVRAIQFQLWLGLLVIILGTLVTGSGPHAGDSTAVARMPFDPRIISWIHADVVVLFCGLAIGLCVALVALHAPSDMIKYARLVILVCILQGILGYTQYFTGLPWVLVLFHVVGACLLWIVTLRLYLARNTRGY